MENYPIENEKIIKNKTVKTYIKVLLFFLIIFFLIFIFISYLIKAPSSFKIGEFITIEEGASLRSISKDFKEIGMIKSRTLFESFVIIFGGEKHISPGDYLFKEKLGVIELAKRISNGEKGVSSIKITIPEGFDLNDMASIFDLKLHNFNQENFLLKTKNKEGYLFPDTYFFLTSDDEDDVIKLMSSNFDTKTLKIFEALNKDEEKIREIIIMASILEREASGDTDRDLISGILWKRIDLNMPLQVDAELSTYKEKGLPKNPICNPGLKTIYSAMNPVSSSYLYYLHDKEGNTHFAENFKEHRQNIEKYLK